MLERRNNGFTIIEVVLVLAIAGLIFLMVFIALPSLQAARRDVQRRNDVGIIVAAVKEYTKHNGGKAPPDSGNDSSSTYHDEYGNWMDVLPSKSLERYLTDLDDGGVTRIVSVRNLIEKKSSRVNYRIDNNGKHYYDVVSVYVGSKCPEDISGKTITFNNTWNRQDIAVVRYMERGYWYCQEV